MNSLTIGVIGTSFKENERRVPIHPEQIDWIDLSVRKKMYFEIGYGLPFQIQDEQIEELTAGMLDRKSLF